MKNDTLVINVNRSVTESLNEELDIEKFTRNNNHHHNNAIAIGGGSGTVTALERLQDKNQHRILSQHIPYRDKSEF